MPARRKKRFSSVIYDPIQAAADAKQAEPLDRWASTRSKFPKLVGWIEKWTQRAEVILDVERVETRAGKISVTARYHRLPRSIDEDFRQTSKILGTGFNGAVRLAESRSNPEHKYAVKGLRLHSRKLDERERLIREMEIYLTLDHPHIARLFEVFEAQHRLDLVMECMEGGELFDRIANKKGVFPEEDAADAIWQMLLAVNYIHTRGIVHRDLKLENFMYVNKDGNILKLIDFGFSKLWDPNSNKTMGLTVGTLSYMAPEVIKHCYTSQCDMWSLGVIAFSLLMGYMPFSGSAHQQSASIERGKYLIKPAKWDALSAQAQDFLTSLLQVDHEKRLNAEAALKHQWITTMKKEESTIDSSVVDALRTFTHASHFRRCCMAMMAWSLSTDERIQVSAFFIALDTSRDGHITRVELQAALQDKFNVGEEELEQILNAMDSNKDGEIHYSDFLAAMVSTKIQLHDEILKATFNKFDIDRTGEITESNLRQVLGDMYDGVKVKTLMEDLELAQRNRISYPEFEKYLLNSPVSRASRTKRILTPQRGWLSCFPCCSA
mmetsp:Transcript_88179/g.175086  ORF Transcript_88179/g.175086 Transcript_88179/m.175086 type:complete len:551 (+) Transcript_88179:117-1769(+)